MDSFDPRHRYLLLDAQGEPCGTARTFAEAECPPGGAVLDQDSGEYFDEAAGLIGATGAELAVA